MAIFHSKRRPTLLAWAPRPVLSHTSPTEIYVETCHEIGNQQTSLELCPPPHAVADAGELPDPANHVTRTKSSRRAITPSACASLAAPPSWSHALPRACTVVDVSSSECPSLSTTGEVKSELFSSRTPSLDRTSARTRRGPKTQAILFNNQQRKRFAEGALLNPRCSAVEKQVLYDIYSRQAQAALVTAADLQVAERHAGACEDGESFAEPPTSDDQAILRDGEIEPVLSGSADTLKSIECQLGTLLADGESSSE
jgi:hypothetical protein